MLDKYIVLNNGVKIPQFGLGTWFIDDDKAADAVKAAAEMGYRHIDTAQAYGNERGVGEGVRNCGIPREEMFVVSKVAAEHKTYEEAMEGINETLEKMGLDYLDMRSSSAASSPACQTSYPSCTRRQRGQAVAGRARHLHCTRK